MASSLPPDPFFAIVGHGDILARQLNFEARLRWVGIVPRRLRDFLSFQRLLRSKVPVRACFILLFSFCSSCDYPLSKFSERPRCMSRSCKNFRCLRCRTSFIRSTLASRRRSRDYSSISRSNLILHLFLMVSRF